MWTRSAADTLASILRYNGHQLLYPRTALPHLADEAAELFVAVTPGQPGAQAAVTFRGTERLLDSDYTLRSVRLSPGRTTIRLPSSARDYAASRELSAAAGSPHPARVATNPAAPAISRGCLLP